jgi:hypothetical protein
VQALGSIGAILAAILLMHWQHNLGVNREKERALIARRGHLAAIEAELRHCDDQCSVYLAMWIEQQNLMTVAPAYRLPTIGYEHSLPSLINEESLKQEEFGALVQFYVDALSFNRCLDNLEQMEIEGQGVMHGGQMSLFGQESKRAATKALHLVSQACPVRGAFPPDMSNLTSRFEPALAVVARHRAAQAERQR